MDTMLGYGDYDMVQDAAQDMTSINDCINHAKLSYKDAFGVTFFFHEKFGADCFVYSTEVDQSKWQSGDFEQGYISCVLQET